MAYTSKCEMTIYLKLRIYRKIPKISRGAYVYFSRPSMRGLSTEGNLCFKIDRASHIVGRKFTIFALFALYLGAISKLVQAPRGGGPAHIRRDNLTEGCLRYEFGGLYLEQLIHGGAYFRNFTVCNPTPPPPTPG